MTESNKNKTNLIN